MSHVLIVDDSEVARAVITHALGDEVLTIREAVHGLDALSKMEEDVPDMVITDLLMPEMDGLEFVAEAKKQYPQVPVMLVTAHGSEDAASQALHQGAAGYVPKRCMESELLPAVRRLLAISTDVQSRKRLLRRMRTSHSFFELENDYTYFPSLIAYLRETIEEIGICDPADSTRVCVALDEALANALYHGNLEIDSAIRDKDMRRYYQLAKERALEEKHQDRRIHVEATLSPSEARFVIRDEGQGFDVNSLPDPTDSSNLEKLSGRGVLLMMVFMDEVHFNERGNEVTMVKRPVVA